MFLSDLRKYLVAIAVLGLFCSVKGQEFFLSPEHRAAMKKLEFLVGTWEGEAWSEIPNQPKETIAQTETVRWDLGESVLVIEGLGIKPDAEKGEGSVVHQALGILAFDPMAKEYRLHSFVADGRSTVAKAHITDAGEFVWITEAGNGYTIRYTISLNDAGQWVEVGEWSRDGQNWRQFFGMTLNRVK